MIKVKIKEDKMVLYNLDSKIEFELFDKKLFNVIKKNIDYLENDCSISIETTSSNRSYIVLVSSTYHESNKKSREKVIKLIITREVAYEISSRLLLLNKSLSFPKRKQM